MTTPWWTYLNGLRDPDMSDRQVAMFVEVTPATVSRWKGGQKPGAAEVVRTARAYGANVVDALVAGGILGENEAEAYRGGQISLADVPLAALLDELRQRFDAMEMLGSTRSMEQAVSKRVAKGFFQ